MSPHRLLHRDKTVATGCREISPAPTLLQAADVDLPLPYAGSQWQVEVGTLATQDVRCRGCVARPDRGFPVGLHGTHTGYRPPTAACTDAGPRTATVAGTRCGSGIRLRDHLKADERRDRCGRVTRRRGAGRARRQRRLPSGLWVAQDRGRTGAGWIARAGGADDRGHDLRLGVVDEVPRNGGRHHAALRTGQDRVRRSGAEVPARLQHDKRPTAC